VTWASYSDDFTGRPDWDGVSYPARWHYIAMVERVCRDQRWNGKLPRNIALRASDVPDPHEAVRELETFGWVADDGTDVQLMYVEDHVPPQGQRPDHYLPRKRRNQAAYRQRRCDEGKHDRHCPKGCPARVSDGLPVTPGRDGTVRGGELNPPLVEELAVPADDVDPWAPAVGQ
jgi:hypothetical protein